MTLSSVLRPSAFLVAAVLFCAAVPAAAAEGEPKLASIVGALQMHAVEGLWLQRILRVSNPTAKPADVRVAYVTNTASSATGEYTRSVTIPPQAERLVTLAARPEKFTFGAGFFKIYPRCYEKYALSDAGTGRLISSQEEQVAGLPGDVVTICVLRSATADDSRDYDNHLFPSFPKDKTSEATGEAGTIRRTLGQTERLAGMLRLLPDRWYGYQMARMVIVTDVDLRELRPSQVQALQDWTARGGLLVIAGSPRMPEILAGELGRLAGAAAVGTHGITNLTIRGGAGEPVSAPLKHPAEMVDLSVEDAEVVLWNDGLPLLTQRPYGQGRVAALAVPLAALDGFAGSAPAAPTPPPPPAAAKGKQKGRKPAPASTAAQDIPAALAANPQARVLEAIGQVLRTRSAINPAAFADSGARTLNEIAGRRGPAEHWPLLILGSLAAVSFAGGAALRLMRRGELLWLALIPLSLLLAGGMYIAGAVQTDPERLSAIGLVCGDRDGRAHVQQVFAYYSGPEARQLTLAAGAGDGVIQRLGAASGLSSLQQTRTDSTISLPEEPVRPNTILATLADATAPTEGLAASATFGPAGLEGVVANRLPADVDDAVILVNRRAYRLGKLPAGGEARLAIDDGKELAPDEYTGSLVHSQTDALRNGLVGSLAAKPSLKERVDPQPVIVGYSSLQMLDPLAGRAMPRQGWSVVCWPLSLKAPAPGTRVLIPSGFVRRQIEGGAAWSSETGEFRDTQQDAELLIRALPPEGLRLGDAKARLRVALFVSDSTLTINGVTEDAKGREGEISLKDIRNPKAEIEMTVDEADRFRSPVDGAYVFRLKVSLSKGGGLSIGGGFGGEPSMDDLDPKMAKALREAEPAAGGGGTAWKFLRADVALEGVSQ